MEDEAINNEPLASDSSAPAPPVPGVVNKSKQENSHPSDPIGFAAGATDRYRGMPAGGVDQIRNIFTVDLDEQNSFDIREVLAEKSDFFTNYEAYAIAEMEVIVQLACNWLKAAGNIVVGYVQDPERTNIPQTSEDDDETMTDNRYQNLQLQRIGDSFIMNMPVLGSTYFTGPVSDRFTSPGRFFITTLTPPAKPAGAGDVPFSDYQYEKVVAVTINAKVMGYCKTIREINNSAEGQFDLGILADTFQVDKTAPDNNLVLINVPTQSGLPEELRGTVYLFDAKELKITATTNEEEPRRIIASFFTGTLEWIGGSRQLKVDAAPFLSTGIDAQKATYSLTNGGNLGRGILVYNE